MFTDLARKADASTIDLRMTIYVTRTCNPDVIPQYPNCQVTLNRPFVGDMLSCLLEDESALDGGVAVCASGPASLTRETRKVVANTALLKGIALGGIALHTEVGSF